MAKPGRPKVPDETRDQIEGLLTDGGLSQSQIAKETGVSTTFVSKLRKQLLGEKKPDEEPSPEPKEERATGPKPKVEGKDVEDLGVAGGIATVYSLAGQAVEMRSPGAGQSMQFIAPYVGESWESVLKRHEKILKALAPFLKVAEDAEDIVPSMMIPFLVWQGERFAAAGMEPPPQLRMAIRTMMIPVLETMAKNEAKLAVLEAKLAKVQAQTGVNIDGLIDAFIGPVSDFRPPPEEHGQSPSVDGGGPEAPQGPYIPLEAEPVR